MSRARARLDLSHGRRARLHRDSANEGTGEVDALAIDHVDAFRREKLLHRATVRHALESAPEVTTERSVRICRALAAAAMLEEKARANPSQAAKLTELARKMRVGAAMLESEMRRGIGRRGGEWPDAAERH